MRGLPCEGTCCPESRPTPGQAPEPDKLADVQEKDRSEILLAGSHRAGSAPMDFPC